MCPTAPRRRSLLVGCLLVASACGFDASADGSSPVTLGETASATATTSGPGDGSTGEADLDGTNTSVADASSDGDDATTASPACGNTWWNDLWSRRTRMRFRGGLEDVEYPQDGTNLSDMPVLVVLTPARIDLAAVAPDGSDLRFVDVNGTLVLPHEIEHWDPNGTSWVWVRIPTVPYLDDTYSFWVYYGNPEASSVEAGDEVWSGGYRGVWHLAEEDGPLRNAAENRAHADPGNTSHAPEGMVAGARRFAGDGDQRVLFGPDSSSYFDGWSSFTLSLWVLPDYPDDESWEDDSPAHFIHKGRPMNNGVATRSNASWDPDVGRGRIRFRFGPEEVAMTRDVALTRQAWSWIAYTFDGETLRTYLDGVEVGEDLAPAATLAVGTEEVRLGHPSDPLLGAVDEVRFADTARSWVWLEAQYRSMTDQLLAYSLPESCP